MTRTPWRTGLLTATLALLPGAGARGEPEDASKVYQEVLKSVVWIHASAGKGKVATGSGSLIDRDRRLVLTNYHVVGENDRVTVVFPTFLKGKLVAERDYYADRLRR